MSFLFILNNKSRISKKKAKLKSKLFKLYIKNNFKKQYIENDKFFAANKNILNNIYPYYNFKDKLLICLDGFLNNLDTFFNNSQARNYNEAQKIEHIYKKYGSKIFQKINGSYSILIFDEKKNLLFFSADNLASKSLFYNTKGPLVISSSIKHLYELNLVKFKFNLKKFDEFLVHGTIACKQTLHKNIYKILPGVFINKKRKQFKFWYPVPKKFGNRINFQKKKIILKKKIDDVFFNWSNRYTKIGIVISGGLDSTYLAHKILSIKTNKKKVIELFTVFFENDRLQDERSFAKIISSRFKVKHHFIKFNENDIKKRLFKILSNTFEPMRSLNIVTFDKIFDYIKIKKNIINIFSGEGADEIFAGYKRHKSIVEDFNKNRELSTLILSLNHLSIDRLKKIKKNFSFRISNYRKKLAQKLRNKDSLNKYLELDQLTFLPPTLQQIDSVAKIHGLEMHNPYCDKKIIEFSHQLNYEDKINMFNNFIYQKFILRKIADNNLSKKIVWNKKKWQFHFPSAKYLNKGVLRNLFIKYINKKSYISNFFDINKIYNLLSEQSSQKWSFQDHSNTLERILITEIWYKKMIKYL